MIESDLAWLAERARSGNPTDYAYILGEAYPGERADLMQELRIALVGCPDIPADAFATMMQQAMRLNALPVLRAVVALWRDAYRNLLDPINDPQQPVDDRTEARVLLSAEEQASLTAFKRGLKRR